MNGKTQQRPCSSLVLSPGGHEECPIMQQAQQDNFKSQLLKTLVIFSGILYKYETFSVVLSLC